MNLNELLGRSESLFSEDVANHEDELNEKLASSKILVIGGAGSIGQAVCVEIFKRDPKVLHVVDISENNLVELVRTLRSSIGYQSGEFKTFAIDSGSLEFDNLVRYEGPYDYVLNLSALKHVRSERDPYTLMRLIRVNILNTIKTLDLTANSDLQNYFCVSTDKAANPINMMGGSKRIMEMFLMRESFRQKISMARFANVAFSDGSLLHGFNQRFINKQPLSAPKGIKRYFITPQESGELCLMSCLLGHNRQIFFPKLSHKLKLISFTDIAERYLSQKGFSIYMCDSEKEARDRAHELTSQNLWPCYFFESDTTGEKEFEEFYTSRETLDLCKFSTIGVITNTADYNEAKLDKFLNDIKRFTYNGKWSKKDLVDLFHEVMPEFHHEEMGKNLDGRM